MKLLCAVFIIWGSLNTVLAADGPVLDTLTPDYAPDFKTRALNILDQVDGLITSDRIDTEQARIPLEDLTKRTWIPNLGLWIRFDTGHTQELGINPTTLAIETVDHYALRIFIEPQVQAWLPVFTGVTVGGRAGLILARTYTWDEARSPEKTARFLHSIQIIHGMHELAKIIKDEPTAQITAGSQNDVEVAVALAVQGGMNFTKAFGLDVGATLIEEGEYHQFRMTSHEVIIRDSTIKYIDEQTKDAVALSEGTGVEAAASTLLTTRWWIREQVHSKGSFNQTTEQGSVSEADQLKCELQSVYRATSDCSKPEIPGGIPGIVDGKVFGKWKDVHHVALIGILSSSWLQDSDDDGSKDTDETRHNFLKGEDASISLDGSRLQIQVKSPRLQKKWIKYLQPVNNGRVETQGPCLPELPDSFKGHGVLLIQAEVTDPDILKMNDTEKVPTLRKIKKMIEKLATNADTPFLALYSDTSDQACPKVIKQVRGGIQFEAPSQTHFARPQYYWSYF